MWFWECIIKVSAGDNPLPPFLEQAFGKPAILLIVVFINRESVLGSQSFTRKEDVFKKKSGKVKDLHLFISENRCLENSRRDICKPLHWNSALKLELKISHLFYPKTNCHLTWHGGELRLEDWTHEATWPYRNLVTWQINELIFALLQHLSP